MFVQLLIYGVTSGAVVALSAAGFTLTYAVARQINLAHGSMVALCTVIVTSLAGLLGITSEAPLGLRLGALFLLCLAGAMAGAVLNVGVQQVAFRPFAAQRDPLMPLVASVGVAFVLLQAAVWWHVLRFVPLPNAHQGVDLPLLAMPDLVPRVELGCCDVSFTLKDALVLLLAGLVAVSLAVWLARTRGGLLLRAAAEDADLTALLGGDTRRAQVLAFAIGGAVAGFGAAIFAAYFGGASAQYGLRSGLMAMTAALLGGVGNPRGALLGGFLIGTVGAFSDFLLDAHWTPVIVLLLLITVLMLRPGGLLSAAAELPRQSALVALKSTRIDRWQLAAMLAAVALFPWLDAAFGWQRLPSATMALIVVALALGLTLVVGFAGLLDLGYAAFFAIGSYAAAILTSSGSRVLADAPAFLQSPWLGLLGAGMVAAGFGLLFGIPSIRTRGEYLAIVTLALGEIVPLVIWHLPQLTGGPRGMSGVPSVGGSFGTYAVAAVLASGVFLATLRLSRSRVGRAWAAVREDELAAGSLGVDAPRFKLLAFALGAGCAGVAGAVFVQLFGTVEPSQFDLTVSLMVLAAVIIGGRWGIRGIVLAAVALTLYDRVVVELLGGLGLRQHNYFVFGMALLLATLSRSRLERGPQSAFSQEAPREPGRSLSVSRN